MSAITITDSGQQQAAFLRRAIRTPIHRVISFAEMITETAECVPGSPLLEKISGVIRICEAMLRSISAPVGVSGELDASRDILCACVANSSGELLALSNEIRALLETSSSTTALADARKLRDAAEALSRIPDEPAPAPALPRLRPVAAPAAISTPIEPANTPGGLVLVVDDNEDNRDVLSRRLLRDGREVMLAESGRQALRMLGRYPFDLVLLDIMMPDMDGYAVLAEIKRNPTLAGLPVVMITAVDEVESIVRCIELGADDYLLKPFNRVLLRARVNALLERKRLRDEELRAGEQLRRMVAEIAEQRRRSRALLVNILPDIVAEELETNGSVQPMYYEDVTVVFTDIVGFTRSTEELPAEELVGLLHEYFTGFDKIVDRYGLEKLKTIGDSYMFAGGLPVRSPSGPVDCVLAGLEMAQFTEEMALSGPVNWRLRIGVNTGPVIAGVVGIRKFAFDIWGDAVNFASRMESASQPGRVNVSSNTFTRVRDFFDCEKQERVRVKEGRDVATYLVGGVSKRLVCKSGVCAREAFERRYRVYFRKDPPAFPDFLTVTGAPESAAQE